MFHHRLLRSRQPTDDGGIDRHLPPAEQRLPLLTDDLFEGGFAALPLVGVVRQENKGGGVSAGGRQANAVTPRLAAEEGVGKLKKNTGAVSGVLIAPTGAAVLKIAEQEKSVFDESVALAPVNVRKASHPARVMFVCGIIQAVRSYTCGVLPPVVRRERICTAVWPPHESIAFALLMFKGAFWIKRV